MIQVLIIFYSLFLFTTETSAPLKKKLVWSDEFDYTGAPDAGKWDYELGYIRNKELQFYTNRNENVRVENGFLIIEARNDSFQIEGKAHPITSASLMTKNKAEWKYGRIEVKAKIPSSLGTWPAIWMLGTNIDEVGWPACGEIDIMEHVGFDPDVIHTNVHTKAYNHSIGTNKGQATEIKKPYENFHVYTVDWDKEKMDFFIDNKKVFTFKNEGKGVEEWPFDQPFYLILNLAIGGAWGGQQGVDYNALPLQYYIDYVRVYQ
jgi:beta-glucanase (GH16 family)